MIFFLVFAALTSQASIKANDKQWTTRIGIAVPTLEIEIKPDSKALPAAKNIKLRPNAPTKTFISLSYDWLGFSVGAVNPVEAEKDRIFGESKATDYQLRFYFSKIAIEAFYQQYKGYYVENTQDVVAGWTDNLQRRLYPDLSTEHMGLSITYVFSPEKYSMSAAFDQASQQTASGGSWMLNFSASDHHLENSAAIIPTELVGTYGEFEKVKSGKLLAVGIGGGGGYNLVFGSHYFASVLLNLNLSSQALRYEKTDSSGSESLTGILGHAKIAIGYNGDKFITGMSIISDSATYKIEKVDTVFQTLEFAVFFGTRFGL